MPADDRRHLLVLTDMVGDGGAERIAVDLLRHGDPERFRRSLCLTRPDRTDGGGLPPHVLDEMRAEGVELLKLDRRGRFDFFPWLRFIRFLRDEKVDVIHAHKFGSNFWAAVLGQLGRVPVVVAHEHTWSFEGHHARRRVDRWVIGRFADAVIAVSEADQRRMIELVGMPAERIVLIPNGIPALPAGDGAGARAELGIDAETPLIVLTAVLRPQKAIDVMLEAMAILHSTVPDARLVVIGPGDTEGYSAAAAALGVGDVVDFIGHRPDVPMFLASANIGVLSSDFEGSPLSVLEYMAAGLPVVATRVGGLPQLVEEGRSGLLVPRRDPAALAAALARLITERDLAIAMGARGRALQQSKYSSEAMATRVYGLYDELLDRAHGRANGLSRRT